MNRKWFFIPLGMGMVIGIIASVVLILSGLIAVPLGVLAATIPGAGGMDVQIGYVVGVGMGLYNSDIDVQYDYDGDGTPEEYDMLDVELGVFSASDMTVIKYIPLPSPLNAIYKTLAVKITIDEADAPDGASVTCHDVYIEVFGMLPMGFTAPIIPLVIPLPYTASNMHIFWLDRLSSTSMTISHLSVGLYLCKELVKPPLELSAGQAPSNYPEMFPGPY